MLYSIKTELKNIALYYDKIPEETKVEVMSKFIVTYNEIAIKMPEYQARFLEYPKMTKSAMTSRNKSERVHACESISESIIFLLLIPTDNKGLNITCNT